MLVDLIYNPEAKVWDYPGVEKVIEDIREVDGDEVANNLRNLKWGNILKKLSTGVYEYYDVNDPCFEGVKFKNQEYVTPDFASELHYPILLEKGGLVYISYPYGVCDSWEQIFEKISELRYYQESKEKFVIFLCAIRKEDQPEEGGWRWCKWGKYIGEQRRRCEYLVDEPEIEKVYTFQVSRVIYEN